MKGVWGKVLKVDLTNGTCKAETLPDKVYEYFFWGGGIGGLLHVERMPGRNDGLQPGQPAHLCRRPHDGH